MFEQNVEHVLIPISSHYHSIKLHLSTTPSTGSGKKRGGLQKGGDATVSVFEWCQVKAKRGVEFGARICVN